jgi:uncharacterized protein (TIGR03437 family)
VTRVWYSSDGLRLFVRTGTGKTLETIDFENWIALENASLPPKSSFEASHWRNLTEYRGMSIVGGEPVDAAVSPVDPNEATIATAFGVWRTLDGGASWNSLNAGLANLPVSRIVRLPNGTQGTRILLDGHEMEAVWNPGEKSGWRVEQAREAANERVLAESLAPFLGGVPSRVTVAGSWIYAGGEGRFWVSPDRGLSWRTYRIPDSAGTVEAIYVAAAEPAIAIAAIAAESGARVVRTMNGGIFWDDISADLPPGAVRGVAGDLETGAVYAAADSGLYWTVTDLRSGGAATAWTRIPVGEGRPGVRDVVLDADGNQIFAALDGEGLVTAVAPHRFLSPRVVNAASGFVSTAAPGTLLSVLGTQVSSARVGELEVPVLAASEMESQIQVPFAVTGNLLNLDLQTSQARRSVAVPLRASSPAIFTDRDGTPIVLDAERALLLDGSMPARAGSVIQILATGLGRVAPEWPAGLAAPVEAPPKVVAPVQAILDRVPLQVLSATLAPGYVGFYLIEAKLPEILNFGPAELYLETDGTASNRVSLQVAP